MKPKADESQILTGEEAIDHMVSSWSDIGLGMASIEIHEPWLIIRRDGGDYSMFISVIDDTAVTILDGSATTRHIPEEYRPDGHFSDEQTDTLSIAMSNMAGGAYPVPNEGVFEINYEGEDGERMVLRIGLTDDTFHSQKWE